MLCDYGAYNSKNGIQEIFLIDFMYIQIINVYLTASLSRAVTPRSSSKSVSRVGAVALISRDTWSATLRHIINTLSVKNESFTISNCF